MKRVQVAKICGAAVAAALVVVGSIHGRTAVDSPSTTAAPKECAQRATVIGARGSGDPQSGHAAADKYGDSVHGMGKPGAALAVALANRLARGRVTFLPVIYPAVGLLGDWRKILNLGGAVSNLGFLGAYTGSVNDGKRILRQEISTERRLCPKVKLVLVGYSQGAQVVADVYSRDLNPQQRSQIAGVVLFGDPYFNPADSAFDQGSFDPTRHGILGTRPRYPASAAGRIFSICHSYDPICQGPGRIDFNQHTNYQYDAWIKIAAAKIAARLNAAVLAPPTHGGGGVVAGQRIGSLALGRSTEGDVRSFAGAPDHVRLREAGEPPPDEGVGNFSGTLWGYNCPADPTQGWCSTYYGFRGGRVVSFETSSASFQTAKGTKVGSSSARATQVERGIATLTGVQCPGIVLPAPANTTFVLGANTKIVDLIFLGLKNGSFSFCGT